MNDILELYARPYNPREPIVCADEKTKELHANLQDSLPLTTKHGIRVDYHYKRNGSRNIFVAAEPLAGKRRARVTARKTKQDYAQFVHDTVKNYYPTAEKVHWVADNFSTHSEKCLREILGDDPIFNRLVLHFTPVHGSWLNQAEIEINLMSRQSIKGRIPNEATLAQYVGYWVHKRNASKAKINWKFTREKAREKFKLNNTLN
jgi:hypothetical protein